MFEIKRTMGSAKTELLGAIFEARILSAGHKMEIGNLPRPCEPKRRKKRVLKGISLGIYRINWRMHR